MRELSKVEVQAVSGGALSLGSSLTNGLSSVTSTVSNLFSSSNFGNLGSTITDSLNSALSTIGKEVTNVTGSFSNTVQTDLQKLANQAVNFMTNLVTNLGTALGNLLTSNPFSKLF